MAISVGDTLPDVTFHCVVDGNPGTVTTKDVFSGRKVVLFAVPGAFTPTCHNDHMPGFVEHADAMKAKGVDEIAVVSVNDVFVMDAWAGISGAEGKIRVLCDPNAEFAKAIDMALDLTSRGLGIRSDRYAMIVEDGKVTTLNSGDAPGQATVSSAENILEAL